jgi:ubiquinone/menaquinone biosynthesis C-methylase UbiE
MQPIQFNYGHAQLFAEQYYQLRKTENRICSDEELLQLPDLTLTHPLFSEWRIRKNSCDRLFKYLSQRKTALQVLEVGCGNGWLSARLAKIKNITVTGIDVNVKELEQAQRVFGEKANLKFVAGDIKDGILEDKIFDIIVFAASIQYFPSLGEIITTALRQLSLQGEIHIMDSHFYKQPDINKARLSTKIYFETIGFAGMEQFYFHHCIDDLKKFNYHFTYDPAAWINRLAAHKNPFYHVVIKNRYQ